MFARFRQALIGCTVLFLAGFVSAQNPQPKADVPPPIATPKVEVPPPPARELVAARVNGQAIPELAVYRGLTRVPPQRREEARKDVLSYLIDNTIVDQYLMQLKIQIEAKEVDEHIKKIKDEAIKDKQDFKDILKKLLIDEDELRTELTNSLRWDKFVLQQGTEKVLQQFFTQNIEMFNGSRVRARHILIPIVNGKKDEALTKITAIKKNIEVEVEQAMTKLPVNSDNLTREKERAKALEKAFVETAMKESTCPSKRDGGDLDFFARVRDMVEPFARAAFALRQFQMSDPVNTEFGYHLILAIDSKPGKEVKFEQAKPFVQEVYSERLREAVLSRYRPEAKIEIVEKKK
jgi:peptidyl-prolyl cis-trans isomerase C